MFSDGTSVGRDSGSVIPQVKARLRSEFDLLTAIRDRAAKAQTDTIVPWLMAVAKNVTPGTRLTFGTDPYRGWYAFYSGQLAGTLARAATKYGVARIVSDAEVTLQNKPYPELIITQ